MKPVLVDTNIVSFIFKRDSRALPYIDLYLKNKLWFISFMTQAELYRWAIQYGWGERKRTGFSAYMTRYTVLPWEPDLNFKWAEVMDAERRMGRSMGHSDAWIAATALLYDLPLVTHNIRHFSGIDGLEILSV